MAGGRARSNTPISTSALSNTGWQLPALDPFATCIWSRPASIGVSAGRTSRTTPGRGASRIGATLPGSFYDPNRFELRGGVAERFLGIGNGHHRARRRADSSAALHDRVVARLLHSAGFNLAGSSIWPEGRASFMPTYCGPRIGPSACSVKCFSASRFTTGTCCSVDEVHNALGCRALFHVGFNLGYRLDQNWRVIATYDHSSAGQAVTGCPANESLNQAGLKFGYHF